MAKANSNKPMPLNSPAGNPQQTPPKPEEQPPQNASQQTPPPAASSAEPSAAPPPPVVPPAKPGRGRQGNQQRPICPTCNVAMVAVNTPPPGIFTWYACPNRHTARNPAGTCNQPRVKLQRPERAQLLHRQRQRNARPRIDDR